MLRPSTEAPRCSPIQIVISRPAPSFTELLATPLLLGNGPPFHPILNPGVAIVLGCGLRLPTLTVLWAALSVHIAAPLLLAYRPPSLPIEISRGAVEGVDCSR